MIAGVLRQVFCALVQELWPLCFACDRSAMRRLRLQMRSNSLLWEKLPLKTRVIRRRFRYEDGTRNLDCDSTGEEGK